MRKLGQLAAAAVVAAGFGLAVVGCTNSPPPPGKDKMGGDKMGGDKMGGTKMSGDKMGSP